MAQPQPHRKPAKQLDASDLPDPLGDSQDVPMASAEDLLSEIAGDDVERLMSGEYEPVPTTGRAAVEQLQHQIGNFLEELRHKDRAAPPVPPAPAVRAAHRHRAHEDDVAPPLDDLVGPTTEELVRLHSGEYDAESAAFADEARGPAESRALLAPVNDLEGESLLLKPLDWISAPIAAMSGRGRAVVSMLAVMSFVGACATLAYVLMLRHGM